MNELGENFEKHRNGFIGFLLLDDKGFPWLGKREKANETLAVTPDILEVTLATIADSVSDYGVVAKKLLKGRNMDFRRKKNV
jgi:hypothetical protein